MLRTLRFNGHDHYIHLGKATNAEVLTNQAFTVEAWVKEAKHHNWATFIGVSEIQGRSEQGWLLGITFEKNLRLP